MAVINKIYLWEIFKEEVIEEEVLEEEIVAGDSAGVTEVEVSVVEIEDQLQCIKQYVMNVTKNVKFLSVHQEISQYSVMNASVVKREMTIVRHEEISEEIADLKEILMTDQLHLLQSQQRPQMMKLRSN
jgi:hypothetical protein